MYLTPARSYALALFTVFTAKLYLFRSLNRVTEHRTKADPPWVKAALVGGTPTSVDRRTFRAAAGQRRAQQVDGDWRVAA